MKKFVTLALALVMALSLAAPSLAFTGDPAPEASTSQDVSLTIRLVDVTNGFLGSTFTAPATNRGYAQNQVVCAIVDMVVAKGKNANDKYETLVFAGKNVSLWQDDNFRAVTFGISPATNPYASIATASGGGIGMLKYVSPNVTSAINEALKKAADGASDLVAADGYLPFSYANDMSVENSITLQLAIKADDENGAEAETNEFEPIFDAPNYAQTYQFAIFGRVLTDDAAISATLKGGGALLNAYDGTALDFASDSKLNMVDVRGGAYKVGYFNPKAAEGPSPGTTAMDTIAHATTGTAKVFVAGATDIIYYVTEGSNTIFAIVADKNFKTKAMYVYESGATPNVYLVQEVTDPASPGATKAPFWNDILVQFIAPGGASALTNPTTIAYLLNNVLGGIVAGEFGLDLRLNGSYMPESFWAGNAELSAEVKVEPWYAEVTVPPEIEIEIPKTGDALSVMGFVLIALAGLAVVAVRKVKA